MRPFDPAAPKKATNLSVNRDLLERAKALNINLSQSFEQHLEMLVREAEQKRWRAENRDAIESYNERIEREGVFSDGLRRF